MDRSFCISDLSSDSQFCNQDLGKSSLEDGGDVLPMDRHSDLYAFPPPSILMKVLEKLRRDRVPNLVLVYPIWTSRPWYPQIKPLIRRPKVPLGWIVDCFLGTRDLLTKLPQLM
ncbi:Hypothetical predicted protein [Pelobates cultripes]|uniref:Uncharacterized protein n=1 Tax=Pelobates cultripes TaxID=61616 RepID=A0AAD1QZI6_PELCU|nr:Hypothetical predicted protein [Pelobates cultripes]